MLDKAWEKLHSEGLIDRSGDTVDYDTQSAELGERLYKITIIEGIIAGDDVKNIQSSQTIEKFTLMRLFNDIMDVIEKFEGEEREEEKIAIMASDDVMLFFTLANEMIRSLSGKVLNEEIVDESHRGESSLRSMKELNPETQEDLLYYSGMIDSGLKGEIARIRKTRNKLVHDLRQRHFLRGLSNLESRIDRTITAINELYKTAWGFEAFTE